MVIRYPKCTLVRIKVGEVEGYLRDFAAMHHHPAGTRAMMSEGLDGVVDEPLKV